MFDQILYKSMIGILVYLTAIRPNITFFVGLCAHYQENPKISHHTQIKRIIKYMSETYDYGILYSFNTNSSLFGYFGTNMSRYSGDIESTSGSCFFQGNNLISWLTKKHNCVSILTTEVEFIVAQSICT